MNEKKSLILMVEDEEQVLNTNCRMLRRRGYDVRTAQTAAEACHQLEEQLPDLLILDFNPFPKFCEMTFRITHCCNSGSTNINTDSSDTHCMS